MNCGQARELLVDLLYEELDVADRASVGAHFEACPSCEARWRQIRAAAAAADRWAAPPVPRGVAERALVRVAGQHSTRTPMVAPGAIAGRVLLGAGAALLSLLLVAGVASRETTVVGAGVVATVWTALYAGLLILSQHPSIRGLVRAALIAAGASLLLVPATTIPGVVEACERWVQAARGSAPMALILMTIAAAYTAGPLVLGAAAARRESAREWIADGLKLSGLYALLIAPAVALQCVALPLDTTALWMAGALAGCAAAGPAGLRLGGWLRRATAP
jgi:hypothetical protein